MAELQSTGKFGGRRDIAMNEVATKQDIQNLEVTLEQRFDNIVEGLGRMIKAGFNQVSNQFGHVDNQFAEVRKDIAGPDHRLENAELRLDQAAYCFELVELEHRVGALEQHTGIGKK